MPRLAIIGATTWGATLGITLAQKGHFVRLLARTEDEAGRMCTNELYRLPVPSGKFPTRLTFTGSPEKAIADARAVILVVPAQSMRRNIRQIAPLITPSMLVVSASKGLEIETGKRMTRLSVRSFLRPATAMSVCFPVPTWQKKS